MKSDFHITRKIDPTRDALLADGSKNDDNRIDIGPTRLAFQEWREANLALPNLPAMRRYRWQRLCRLINAHQCDGLLVFDPLNIRYATDSTNMQLWNTHNPFRAALVCADGHMVLWDYKNSPFLSNHNPLVKDVRTGASMFYFSTGDRFADKADAFARDVAQILQYHGIGAKKIAIDKIAIPGVRAFDALGFTIAFGEELTEKARVIKGPDEILAMRCASHACEQAVYAMQQSAAAGLSENEIWSVLHAQNIIRGGEWIETRLLCSGPRTSPWFQECGQRIVQNNEILAFDTDLIGCYGICVDISRTWWIGDAPPRDDMIYAMRHAVDHIEENTALLRPGVSFRDLCFQGHQLEPQYDRLKYSVRMHGVGLCDEWPAIPYPDLWEDGAIDYEVEAGMVFCVEALVAPEGGDFSIKLENQVLVTPSGHENLTTYPYDPPLMGNAHK